MFSPFGDSPALFAHEDLVPELVHSIPLLWREIFIRIPINIIDRMVSVFIAYVTALGIAALFSMANKLRSH
jgi:hypothetical protein